MSKIKLDPALFERVKKVAQVAGYTSPEEFIVHIVEKELAKMETAQTDDEITERLRGLGYIE